MGDRYGTADGWSVEVVHLTGTPGRHDGEWIRVRQHGAWITDVCSIAEIERWVSLADLEPELSLAA